MSVYGLNKRTVVYGFFEKPGYDIFLVSFKSFLIYKPIKLSHPIFPPSNWLRCLVIDCCSLSNFVQYFKQEKNFTIGFLNKLIFWNKFHTTHCAATLKVSSIWLFGHCTVFSCFCLLQFTHTVLFYRKRRKKRYDRRSVWFI